MSTGRICVRIVHVASPGESVQEAARRMRDRDAGCLVVVDADGVPLGIVTDRDVAVRCVAEGREPDATPVSDVMTAPAHGVHETTPIEESLRHMAGIGARRLVVTDDAGRLAGILALDDVLDLLVEETEAIGRLLRGRPRSAAPTGAGDGPGRA
jgi:CBS domain-containing protein